MKTIKHLSTIGLTVMVLIQCKVSNKSEKTLDQTYLEALTQSRVELNKRRVKYLELCGLFKMNEAEMTLGLDAKNQISVNLDQIVKPIGTFLWDKNNYEFSANTMATVSNPDGKAVKTLLLSLDKLGNSTLLFYDSFSWRVITRSGALYLRVWDKNNPKITAFKGFEHYDANPDFIFEADFKYFNTKKSESVESKLGVNDVTTFVGQLTFQYQSMSHTLDVGENGWIMVRDQTCGDTTYGAGRYMYIDLPKKDGIVSLDFNKLYNPPCRYSEFTTCLFPPRQNVLPFHIITGELSEFKQ